MNADTAPYVPGSSTSKEAAYSVDAHVKVDKAQIFELVRQAGEHGLTCSEAIAATGGLHQSVSARIRGLVIDGLIVDSREKRPCVRSGRNHRVYVLAPDEHEPQLPFG